MKKFLYFLLNKRKLFAKIHNCKLKLDWNWIGVDLTLKVNRSQVAELKPLDLYYNLMVES